MTHKFQQMPVPPYPGTREKGKESLVKVAALQMEPNIGNKDRNIEETLKIIDEAGKQGRGSVPVIIVRAPLNLPHAHRGGRLSGHTKLSIPAA